MTALGIVVIGRNEGGRLRLCLESLCSDYPIVYVDSGSTDGSPGLARTMGAEVIELSSDKPFTAARGRNAGLMQLLKKNSEIEFVQFVDGDCEIHSHWFENALRSFSENEHIGILCGHLREKHLDSVYGRLCNLEWEGPVGVISACGGIAMMRVSPVLQVGGFNESVAAGEEADLCIRLSKAGFQTMRIPLLMGTHDAAMTMFKQWWTRATRAGRSFSQGAFLHGGGTDRKHLRALRSILFWGIALPTLAILLLWPSRGLSLVLLTLYGVLWLKIRNDRIARGNPEADAALFATFCILAKFAQAFGVIEYFAKRPLRDARQGARETSDNARKAIVSSVQGADSRS